MHGPTVSIVTTIIVGVLKMAKFFVRKSVNFVISIKKIFMTYNKH